MATAKIPQRVKLMEVQQIAGFSADYLMQAFKQHSDETQLNTIITLCSNLYRVEANLKKLTQQSSYSADKHRYSSQVLVEQPDSTINIQQVAAQFIQENHGYGELTLLRKIL